MAGTNMGLKRTFETMIGQDAVLPNATSAFKDGVRTPVRSRESSISPPLRPASNPSDLSSLHRTINFTSDATIIVIGVRGVGKSSLGFLAASAYSRRLIESERAFADATGSSSTAFRKLQGTVEYHKKHSEVLRDLLAANDKNAVIVCTFSDLENDGAKLIQSFAKTHPVIYVMRDPRSIQSYLRVWSTERIEDLIRASEPLLRSCSNYEFFNLSETIEQQARETHLGDVVQARASQGPTLTLKKTEHDFLKLLRNVIGDLARSRSHQSAYPLSQTSVEKLEYTSAVVLKAEDIIDQDIDLDGAQIGADAVELCLTTTPTGTGRRKSDRQSCVNLASEAFAILKRSTILPIIVSVSKGPPMERQQQISKDELLDHCFRLGPDYCTLDLTGDGAHIRRLMLNKGRTKIIGHYAINSGPAIESRGADLLEIYERARRLGCDLVKITAPAQSFADNFTMIAFQQKISASHGENQPGLIAYCTGSAGRTSMCFNSILTSVSPLHNPNLMSRQARNDPAVQISAKERNFALFSSFIHEPLRFLIYGANVSFSLSPAMHNAAYEACGMPHSYRTHSASDLDDFLTLVREPDFGGAAIVQPFKTTALPLIDVLSPHAKAIGALNTVIPIRDPAVIKTASDDHSIVRNRNKTGPVIALYGDNTDWIGIRACIRRGLSPANTVRPQSTGLVCGAGGMARAAIYAMISLGVQTIFVCNRTRERTEFLAEHYNRLIKANAIVELSPANAATTSVVALSSFETEWPKNARHPTMIVSCIPTQTANDQPTDFTLPKDWLNSRTGGVVVEVCQSFFTTGACSDRIVACIYAGCHATGTADPKRDS